MAGKQQNGNLLLNHWPLALTLSGATIVICLLITFIGSDIDALRLALLVSARVAQILFLAAFVASSLFLVWRHRFSHWLLRNRRYFGVSFAAVFTLHAIGIWYRTLVDAQFAAELEPFVVKHGAFFLGVALVMAFTSTNAAQRGLGVVWTVLHTVGSYYIFLIFFATEVQRVAEAFWPYGIYFLLMCFVLLLRLARIGSKLRKRFAAGVAQ